MKNRFLYISGGVIAGLLISFLIHISSGGESLHKKEKAYTSSSSSDAKLYLGPNDRFNSLLASSKSTKLEQGDFSEIQAIAGPLISKFDVNATQLAQIGRIVDTARLVLGEFEAKAATAQRVDAKTTVISIPEISEEGELLKGIVQKEIVGVLGAERGVEFFNEIEEQLALSLNGWGQYPQNIVVEKNQSTGNYISYSFKRTYSGGIPIARWTGLFNRTIESRYPGSNLGRYASFAPLFH